MRIWNKFIYLGTGFLSFVGAAGGSYYCTVEHSPIVAVCLLLGSGIGMGISCYGMFDSKNGHINCSYEPDESIEEKIEAHQQDHQQEKSQKVELSKILQDAPIAFPIELQIANNEENKEGPKARNIVNPFISGNTNEIFKEN